MQHIAGLLAMLALLLLQIQKQDALEAAVEADDQGKLEQHLQGDEAQVCPSSFSACFCCSCMFANVRTERAKAVRNPLQEVIATNVGE